MTTPTEPIAPLVVDEIVDADTTPPIRRLVWMTILFWMSSFAALAIGDVSRTPDRVLQIVGMRVALTALGFFFCLLIHMVLRRLRRRSFRIRVVGLVLVTPICAELFAWASYFGMRLALGAPIFIPKVDLASTISAIIQFTWLFLAWAGFYFALYYAAEAEHKERRAAQQQVLAQQAQLQALAYQINPHFLFNSLNAVAALMLDARVAEAEQIVTRLSRFLRRTLAVDPTSDVTLGEEVAIQQEYLAIEQVRFPDLQTEFEIPGALEAALLPALSLQPLVENAVKHGIARSAPPTMIRITATSEDGQLNVTVQNSGGIRKGGTSGSGGAGVGLANVRERLSRRFGASGKLIAEPVADGMFQAIVSLPLSFRS